MLPSAFCGEGDMMEALVKTLPPPSSMDIEQDDTAPLSVAIVGRPNVGECSLDHREV